MTEPSPALDELLSTLSREVVQAAEVISLTHSVNDEIAHHLVESFTGANGNSAMVMSKVKSLPFVSPSEGRDWKVASPIRELLAERAYGHGFAVEVDRYLADRLGAQAREAAAASPRLRQLRWRSIYHRVPVDPPGSFDQLDEFLDSAVSDNSRSDLKAAVDLTNLRQRWLTPFQAETAFVRGRSAYVLGEMDVAEREFTLVWESETAAHRRIIAGHLLGVIWSRKPGQQSWGRAVEILKQASRLAREDGDDFGEGVILTTLGTTQVRLGGEDEVNEAERALRRSVEIFAGQNGRREGLALGALGSVLFQKGERADLEDAENVLRRGRSLLPPESHGVIEDRLARVLGRLGGEENLAEAEKLVRKRLDEGGTSFDNAITLNMLAQTLLRRNDRASLVRAEDAASKSIALGRELDKPRHLAMALLTYSWVAEKLGDREGAVAAMEEVLEINEELGFDQQIAKSRRRLQALRSDRRA